MGTKRVAGLEGRWERGGRESFSPKLERTSSGKLPQARKIVCLFGLSRLGRDRSASD